MVAVAVVVVVGEQSLKRVFAKASYFVQRVSILNVDIFSVLHVFSGVYSCIHNSNSSSRATATATTK